MPNLHEHLNLPSIDKTFKRRIHGGGRYVPHEDIKDFATKQVKRLDSMSKKFTKVSEQFPHHGQELVFKIKTSQNVNENDFRERLKNADCETIISTSGKNSEWIMATSDPEFKKLKKRIRARAEKDRPNFVDGISEFKEIDPLDKIGQGLRDDPLGEIEKSKIIVSISKKELDPNDKKVSQTIKLIDSLANDRDLVVYDKLVTENICLLLLDATRNFVQTISQIDLVEKIDRPPKFLLGKIMDKSLQDIGDISSPNRKDHGILVMDSGIILHPLLENAVNQNDGIIGLPDRDQHDDRSHGTKVSGIALYGDIEKRILDSKFDANVWINCCKVFYESSGVIVNSDEKLIENRISDGVKEIRKKFPKCKVVNLSFGNNKKIMSCGERQFDLATLIDDLAKEYHDMVFVVSSGNIASEFIQKNRYPNYLLVDSSDVRITDPGTSLHAISVGAVQRLGSRENQPSNLTRIGPGLNGMIKPELVENGGGLGEEIVVLHPDYRQRPFGLGSGTSFSAPKIANYLARLYNKFPSYDRNLIKALLLSSANLPDDIPDVFPKVDSKTTASQLSQLTSIYGFGKPNLENALFSDDDRVVMKYAGKIKLNQVKYFTINLPDEFVKKRGRRYVSVSLVYDPPIRKTRADYFGIRMEFHLFKNKTVNEVMKKYNSMSDADYQASKVPEELSRSEIILKPGTKLRKKGIHQKGTKVLSTASRIKNENPLVLAVLSQKRWDFDDSFEQSFAVVVTLKHEQSFDLYNKIRINNHTRVRV